MHSFRFLFLANPSVIFAMSRRRNDYDYDDDSYYDDDDRSCCEQNACKLTVVVCLILLAVGCAAGLVYVHIKQHQRERVLVAKKTSWETRLEQCAPIMKTIGPFVKVIIKVAMSLILI